MQRYADCEICRLKGEDSTREGTKFIGPITARKSAAPKKYGREACAELRSSAMNLLGKNAGIGGGKSAVGVTTF